MDFGDGAERILIEDAIVENVAGNGVGLRNHNSVGNHSGSVELRRVVFRGIGGTYAVFGRSGAGEENRFDGMRLVDVKADGLVAFWGPIRKLEVYGGRYVSIVLGFEGLGIAAKQGNALRDARLENVQVESLVLNGASGRIELLGVEARSIRQVRAE